MKIFCPIIDNGMGLSRTSWAFSMIALSLSESFRKYSIVLQSISYPYPDGAMNIATDMFLQTDCDKMLTIDTDVVFPAIQVEWLLSHDVPFVAGIYPKKCPGLFLALETLDGENPFAENPNLPGIEPLVEVKRVARGFTVIDRSVFENLIPSTPIEFNAQTNSEMRSFWKNLPGCHSEDFNFCDKYRSIGGRVMVDQRCIARHEGSVIYPIKGTY